MAYPPTPQAQVPQVFKMSSFSKVYRVYQMRDYINEKMGGDDSLRWSLAKFLKAFDEDDWLSVLEFRGLDWMALGACKEEELMANRDITDEPNGERIAWDDEAYLLTEQQFNRVLENNECRHLTHDLYLKIRKAELGEFPSQCPHPPFRR